MITKELAELRLLEIRRLMVDQFPSGVIGQSVHERYVCFSAINEYLLTKHFYLRNSDTTIVLTPSPFDIWIITESAMDYYADRKDSLSAKDYVTDFFNIVTASGMAVILRP